jgi:tRNA-binding protein
MDHPGSAPPVTDIETFLSLDIRAGTVVRALPFPEARKPSIQLWVDFGPGIGILPSAAQLTRRYTPEGLLGTCVLGVVNFPPRRIAGFRSACLVLGVLDPSDPGDVVLVRPDNPNTRGWRLG